NKIEDDSNTSNYLSLDMKRPDNFDEMISIANKLAQDLIFVRVDLYSIKNKIYFGELTFFPWGGKQRITVERFNKEFGDMIHLPK
ncbi:MAG: ATP-grasp fold amidoligase family protein, partial [Flavobacterium sp.]